jgi:8-oxo-dGTP pyrophosphatase MutT (NUDIX family)
MISKKQNLRPAVFIVVYTKTPKGIEYILLKRKLHWKGWEFPKGKIEKGEAKEKTALREAWEETGLKILKNTVKKFNFSGKYLYHKKLLDRPNYIGQTFTLFSAEAKNGRVKLDSREHSTHLWLSFEKALKKLKWKNQKKSLRIVNKYLRNK